MNNFFFGIKNLHLFKNNDNLDKMTPNRNIFLNSKFILFYQ